MRSDEQIDLAAHWEAIARKSSHYSRGLELRMMKALDELYPIVGKCGDKDAAINEAIRYLEGRKP